MEWRFVDDLIFIEWGQEKWLQRVRIPQETIPIKKDMPFSAENAKKQIHNFINNNHFLFFLQHLPVSTLEKYFFS